MIDSSARISRSFVGDGTEVRENCTIHDSIVGKRCRIYEKVSLKKVVLRKGAVVNAGSHLEYVRVGDDALIGPNCSIVGVYHEIFETGAEKDDTYKMVTVGKNAFIGAGSVILPGVEIGEGSVVGAGSTVTKSVPDFHIWLGAPPNQVVNGLRERALSRDECEIKKPVRVLFVCYGNAARSVMAQYFCNIFGGIIVAESAGIHRVLEKEITPILQKRLIRATLPVMREVGIDISSHKSRHIQQVDISSFDVLVNMSPMSFIDLLRLYCPDFNGTVKEWSVPDPGDESIEAVRKAREQIRKKVIALIQGII